MTTRVTRIGWAVLAVLAIAVAGAAAEAPRTTAEELKAMMDRGDPVVVVDVRRGSDWRGSDRKIRGAVRVEDLEAFAATQARDDRIVLYCA